MAWLQWLLTERWDAVQFDKDSHCLDLLLRRDFGDLRDRIRDRFPNTPNLQIRIVDLVSHYARELADLYALPPIRGFNGKVGQLSQDSADRWAALYDALGVDAVLHATQAGLLCQQAHYIVPMPVSGGFRLEKVAPWRVHAQPAPGQAWRSGDLSAQAEVRVMMPTHVDTQGSIVYDDLVLTPTQAYWASSRAGLLSPDGRNPLGRIPMVTVRLVEPGPGRFHPPVHEALLNEALQQSEQQTDAAQLVRFQAHGQLVITGVSTTEAIKEKQVGPDKAHVLIAADGDQPGDMKVVQAQLNAQQLWGFFESQLRQFAATQGTSGDSFLHVNTALTASARELSLWQRQRMKAAFGPTMQRAEQDLADLLCDLSAHVGVAPLEPVSVVVHYPDRGIFGDRQSNAQALGMEFGAGMTTPSREVAEREGISLAAAKARVEANLKEIRDQGIMLPGKMTQDTATPLPTKAAP